MQVTFSECQFCESNMFRLNDSKSLWCPKCGAVTELDEGDKLVFVRPVMNNSWPMVAFFAVLMAGIAAVMWAVTR